MEQHEQEASFPQLWTIAQVSRVLNLGRTKVYQLIWKEHLPVKRFGQAVRVSPLELQRCLAERGQI